MTEQQRLAQVPELLLRWYDGSRRILPWRENPEPYRVWVSEIMLQQTRVEAVIPYFERFLSALPTVSHLAQAPEPQLMKLWEGLGYYSRVRNLQKAAQVVCEQYGGKMPDTSEQLSKLPGIGAYTAGAIASIAFGERCTAVDGNVLRVISRVLERGWDIRAASVKKQVTALVAEIVPDDRPGDFNQSLMELGAMVCLPNGQPKCASCPLYALCLSREHGRQEEIPVKPPKKQRPVEERVVYLLFRDGKVALHRRPSDGLLAGMWEFPNRLVSEKEGTCVTVPLTDISEGKRAGHVFTHLEWQMRGITAQAQEAGDYCWVTADQLRDEITLPTAFRVYRKQALQILEKQRANN